MPLQRLYSVNVMCDSSFIALCFLLLFGDGVMSRCCLGGFFGCGTLVVRFGINWLTYLLVIYFFRIAVDFQFKLCGFVGLRVFL